MSRPPSLLYLQYFDHSVYLFLNFHSLTALREFVSCVQSIKILSSAEVQQMSYFSRRAWMEIWVMFQCPTKLVVGLTVVMHGDHMRIILLHHLIDKVP